MQYYQTICAVKLHSRALATFQTQYRTGCMSHASFNASVVACLHGCAIACAVKQTFAQCKIFLEGALVPNIFLNCSNTG